MYPAGKFAISRHLVTPGFPQCDHTVGKLSADAGSQNVHFNRKLEESALSMIIFSLAFNMDSSIDMDSSQTRSNGDESRAGNEELRKSYHHLSNSLAECSIDPNHALEQATEMLEKVSIFKFLFKVV